jgi:hypothetical protein
MTFGLARPNWRESRTTSGPSRSGARRTRGRGACRDSLQWPPSSARQLRPGRRRRRDDSCRTRARCAAWVVADFFVHAGDRRVQLGRPPRSPGNVTRMGHRTSFASLGSLPTFDKHSDRFHTSPVLCWTSPGPIGHEIRKLRPRRVWQGMKAPHRSPGRAVRFEDT